MPGDDLVAYLDGNSLGRPLQRTLETLPDVVRTQWGGRLIRAWDEVWLTQAERLGDRIGAACLGAASGQTIVAESTTVLIFKLLRAAIAARPGRDELVILRDEFPTDRYIVDRLAEDHGLSVRWVDAPRDGGVTPDLAASVVGDRTIAALFSGVAYRSAWWPRHGRRSRGGAAQRARHGVDCIARRRLGCRSSSMPGCRHGGRMLVPST